MSALAVGAGLALGSVGVAVNDALRLGGTGGRAGAGHRRTLHRGLIVAQVALSVILLAVAGLFGRSPVALGRVDPGFVADGALTAGVTLPPAVRIDPAAALRG